MYAQAATGVAPKLCPCPAGTSLEKAMSAVTCQNVTNGNHRMLGSTSAPRGSRQPVGAARHQPRATTR